MTSGRCFLVNLYSQHHCPPSILKKPKAPITASGSSGDICNSHAPTLPARLRGPPRSCGSCRAQSHPRGGEPCLSCYLHCLSPRVVWPSIHLGVLNHSTVYPETLTPTLSLSTPHSASFFSLLGKDVGGSVLCCANDEHMVVQILSFIHHFDRATLCSADTG